MVNFHYSKHFLYYLSFEDKLIYKNKSQNDYKYPSKFHSHTFLFKLFYSFTNSLKLTAQKEKNGETLEHS